MKVSLSNIINDKNLNYQEDSHITEVSLSKIIIDKNLIVPDQKVTVGAANAVVWVEVESFLEPGGGGCTCSHFDTQVSRDRRVRVYRKVRFYLGVCDESPIYRDGGLQSRCNGTPGSGGYEIVGSVTAESLLRERAERRCGSFEPVSLAPCTPLARKGCVTSNFAKRGVWALNSIGPK